MKTIITKLMTYLITAVMAATLITAAPVHAADTKCFEVGIDGLGGKFKMTESYGETMTFESTCSTIGKKGYSVKQLGISKITEPKRSDGKKFLGWRVYFKETDGWTRENEDRCLTTKEILNYKLPAAKGVFFIAQWEGVRLPMNWQGVKEHEIKIVSENGSFELRQNNEISETNNYSSNAAAINGVTLRYRGYKEITDPVNNAGREFLGWCVYNEANNRWEKSEGEEFLTGEEVLDYELPDNDIMFMAQWKGITLDDVMGEGVTITLECGEGSTTIKRVTSGSEDRYEWDTGFEFDEEFYCKDENATLKKIGVTHLSDPIHPDGAEFAGWYAYEKTESGWALIEELGKMTTSEMLEYDPSGSIMFYAAWEGEELKETIIRPFKAAISDENRPFEYTVYGESYLTTRATSYANDASTLRECGISSIEDPEGKSGDVFLGWCAYKKTNDGWKKVKGAEELTGEQVLDYEDPEEVRFYAHWEGEPLEDNIISYSFAICGNGGCFKMPMLEISGHGTWSDDGFQTGSIVKENGLAYLEDATNHDGKQFLGWCAYEDTDQGMAKVEGAECLSSEEVLNYKIGDRDIMFRAQYKGKQLLETYNVVTGYWFTGSNECKHDYRTIYINKATTANDGYKDITCSDCGDYYYKYYPALKTVALSETQYVYDGKEKKPAVIIEDINGDSISSDNYTVKYSSGRKAPGTYKVEIAFKGGYSGKKTLSYDICLESPENVSAMLYESYNKAKITWDKVDGATGYYVYYKKATSAKWSDGIKTTKPYYTKSSLSAGTTYNFKVVPYYKTSSGKYVKGAAVIADQVTALKAISAPSVIVDSTDDTKAVVEWVNDGQFAGYEVSKSSSSSKTEIVYESVTSEEGKVVLDAAKGRPYNYKVRGYIVVNDKKIYTPWSKVTKYINPLDPPEDVKAELYGYNDVKVSWSKSPEATGYYVYYKKATGTKWTQGARTTKSYANIKDLTSGTEFEFKVVPYYKKSSSSTYHKSERFALTTAVTMKKLATPVVGKDADNEGNVVVSWKLTGPADAYEISRATSSSKTSVVAIVEGRELTSASIEGAKKGKKYYYKVRAIKYVDGTAIKTPWSSTKYYTYK